MGDDAAKSEGTFPVPSYRGINYAYMAQTGYADIKTSEFSHEQIPAQFEAEVPFYEVAYPYWQFPFNVGPYNQNIIEIFGAGAYHNQSNLGIVGRPRGIGDWDTPAMTPYGVPPDELG